MFLFNEKPLISVIITTYNRVNLLKKALDSVVNQTYKNLEIIVSDNHSTDETEDLLKEYILKDSRIRYFRQPKNIGMTNNTTFAHSKVTGEYFHVLCDDDWLDLDFIEKSYKEFKKHPEYSFIAPTAWLYDLNSKVILKGPIVKLDSNVVENRIKNYVIADRNNSVITNGLLKTCILKSMIEEDGFALKSRFAEDWVFVVKFLIAGKCKMISSTHYNKLHNGTTCRMETMGEFWDITGINANNMYDKIAVTINDSITNDNFCKNRLDVNKQKQSVKSVTDGMNTVFSKDPIKGFLFSPFASIGKIKKTVKFIKNFIIIRY